MVQVFHTHQFCSKGRSATERPAAMCSSWLVRVLQHENQRRRYPGKGMLKYVKINCSVVYMASWTFAHFLDSTAHLSFPHCPAIQTNVLTSLWPFSLFLAPQSCVGFSMNPCPLASISADPRSASVPLLPWNGVQTKLWAAIRQWFVHLRSLTPLATTQRIAKPIPSNQS